MFENRFFWILLAVLQNHSQFVLQEPIVGGHRILSNEIWKDNIHVVSLQKNISTTADRGNFQHICGGSLIAENWILTAAHCVYKKDPKSLLVAVGENSLLKKNIIRYPVIKYVLHNYNPHTASNDIAIVKINRKTVDVNKSTAKGLKSIPNLNVIETEITSKSGRNFFTESYYGELYALYSLAEICEIIGYGAREYGGNISGYLYAGKVKILNNAECEAILGNVMSPKEGDNKICAVGDGVDTCQGDSGGPLICFEKISKRPFIYGIVSHGLNCGSNGVPSIYTLISKYLYWITDTIKQKGNNNNE